MQLAVLFSLLLSLAPHQAHAIEETTESCQTTWTQWLQTYSAESPFGARAKASLGRLDPKVIASLRAKDFSVLQKVSPVFQKQYEAYSKLITDAQRETIKSTNKASDQELLDYWLPLLTLNAYYSIEKVLAEKRNIAIKNNVAALVNQFQNEHKSGKKLLLFWVGGAHSEDFFLSLYSNDPSRRDPIAYVSQPIHDSSTMGTDQYRALVQKDVDFEARALAHLKLDKKNEGRIKTHEAELKRLKSDYVLTNVPDLLRTGPEHIYYRLAWFQSAGRFSKIPVDLLLSEATPPNPQVLLFSDMHTLNETQTFERLPTGSCLQLLGIQEIDVALEGFTEKHAFTYEEILKYLKHQPDGPFGLLTRDFTKRFPNLAAFLDKMQAFEKAGIKVHYTGLEADEDSPENRGTRLDNNPTMQDLALPADDLGL